MKKLGLIASILVLAAGHGRAQPFTDPGGNYTIQLPRGWKHVATSGSGEISKNTFEKESRWGLMAFTINVVALNSFEPVALALERFQDQQPNAADLDVIKTAERMIAGAAAIRKDYRASFTARSGQTFPIRGAAYFVSANKKLIAMFFETGAPTFDRLEPDIQLITASLRVAAAGKGGKALQGDVASFHSPRPDVFLPADAALTEVGDVGGDTSPGAMVHRSPGVGAAVMARAVTEDYEAVDVTDVYPIDHPAFHCVVAAVNVSKSTRYKAEWYAVDAVDEPNFMIDSFELTLDDPQNIDFSLSRPEEGWPAGAYKVVLFVNDEEVKTVEFRVE